MGPLAVLRLLGLLAWIQRPIEFGSFPQPLTMHRAEPEAVVFRSQPGTSHRLSVAGGMAR